MASDKTGQIPQTEVADTPAPQDSTRTRSESDQGDLMSFLDIPDDVRGQLKPREAEPELSGDIPAPPSSEQPESQLPPTEEPSRDEEVADEEPEEEEQEQEQPAAQEDQKPDKRQKRINRLTRQKSELQTKLDAVHAENEQMRQYLAQQQEQQQPAAKPPGVGRLGWIKSEQQLAQEVSKADSVIEWCDQNAEGVTTGSGENEEYVDSEKIARWRREAEKLVLHAPMRREELQKFGQAQNYYNGLVQENWPEILDQRSPDHQMAVAILQFYPWLQQTPQAWYAAGLVIEGAKALEARAGNANGQRQHRDIDERAFAPRVPLAPHSANPPTRTATPSSKQRLNEAMSNLVKDPDGSQSSVAAAFGALEGARSGQRPSGKTPVRS